MIVIELPISPSHQNQIRPTTHFDRCSDMPFDF